MRMGDSRLRARVRFSAARDVQKARELASEEDGSGEGEQEMVGQSITAACTACAQRQETEHGEGARESVKKSEKRVRRAD